MEITVDGSTRNKKWVKALLPSMLKQLNLENCRKGLLIRIKDECQGNEGITLDLTAATGCYLMVIKPKRSLVSIGLTLAHEMVHIKQLAKGTLKNQSGGVSYWAGKKYDSKKTKYLDLPWEVEAYSRQELILRRALEV